MDLTGRIGLVSGGTDWWARRIVEFTHSPYHHVVIGLDNGYCVSAEPDGVRELPQAHYPDIHWLDPIGTLEQQHEAAWHAIQMIDQPYNNRALALASAAALGLPIPRTAIRWTQGHGYTCVTLACAAYAAVGITLLKQPVTSAPKAFITVEATCQPSVSVASSSTVSIKQT